MISLGLSPCPNDIFIFYALINKKIDSRGFDFKFLIEDVEILNQLAMKKIMDITKISCHAFYYLQNNYQFLKTGGAFGRKCGPLLVVRSQESGVRSFDFNGKKIAIPGELTTAFLLLKLYLSSAPLEATLLTGSNSSLSFIAMPFYKIMGAIRDGEVNAGLIIHESRFTYSEYGLSQIIDLGYWWERETRLPIPLGGIVARKSLGVAVIKTVEKLIRASIKYSTLHKGEVVHAAKKYSQQLSEDVILKHISLYVNDYTYDIGDEGEAALNELLRRVSSIDNE